MGTLTNSAKLIEKIGGLNVTKIGSSAPSNPIEGNLWYDTTNDVLKSYDGTNWNVVGNDAADIDVKIFQYPSVGTDVTDVLNRFSAGKEAIFYRSSSGGYKEFYRFLTKNFDRNRFFIGGTASAGITYIKVTYNDTTKIVESVTDQSKIFAEAGNVLTKTNTTSYTPSADYHPATKKYVDKAFNAGTGISISDIIKNGRQGPAPDGFHVPASSERESVKSILVTTFGLTSSSSTLQDYLKMPTAGERNYADSNVKNQGTIGYYRSTTPNGNQVAFMMNFGSGYFYPKNNNSTGYACSIRCFKDTAISPDSSWEILYDGSSIATGAGVFYNSLLGLISLSGDGITWITIQDKNLGATTVYNNGDTLSEANCGKYYQWGNNYGFPRASDATITTSSTKVNASNYGPGNYYSSDTFIIINAWDSSNNQDLWGNTTLTYTVKNAITNTGVLSVNGQTGDVTISAGSEIVYISQDDYDALPSSKLTDGKNYVIKTCS